MICGIYHLHFVWSFDEAYLKNLLEMDIRQIGIYVASDASSRRIDRSLPQRILDAFFPC